MVVYNSSQALAQAKMIMEKMTTRLVKKKKIRELIQKQRREAKRLTRNFMNTGRVSTKYQFYILLLSF